MGFGLAGTTGAAIFVASCPTICCNSSRASRKFSPLSDFTFNRSIACLGVKSIDSFINRMNCGSFRLPLVSTDKPGELGILAPIFGRVGGTTASLLAGVEDGLLTAACAVDAGCLAVGVLAG